MRTITVRRSEPDDLCAQEWDFYFFDDTRQLVLDNYRLLQRATKRHKFTVQANYNRLLAREGSIKSVLGVPLPDDVSAEAKQQFVDGIVVALEYARGGTRF